MEKIENSAVLFDFADVLKTAMLLNIRNVNEMFHLTLERNVIFKNQVTNIWNVYLDVSLLDILRF